MNERKQFNNEEVRILNLLRLALSREFPNPKRVGCPGPAILRGIAFRKLRLVEVEQWLDHLSSCSPRYQEFCEFKKQAHSQRHRT